MLLGIVSLVLVPPASLLILAVAGLVVSLFWRRIGRAMIIVGLIGLWVLALPATSKTLIAALESNLPIEPPPDSPPQAIVLLGGDMSRSAPPAPPSDIGPLSLERERAAARLERQTNLPLLVTGGRLAFGVEPISLLMSRSLAADFGIQTKWLETNSKTTWENAELSAPILQAAGIHSIFVVTHAWHMRRAVLAFRHFGMIVTAAPTQIHLHEPMRFSDLIPRATAWSESYYALHEWIGYAYYALRS